VSRPVVRLKPRDVRLRDAYGRPAFAARAGQEMLHEQRNVLRPLAQRHGLDREHAEPEVEILAEAALLDLAAQIAVRRGDDPHVDLARLLLADALERAFLDHAQELALKLERDLADLVEEEGASVRKLEAADAVAQRAGERALHVAEELALEEIARDRGAVHADQRPLAARARVVDRARDQLLAGARLARDQHGGVGVGDELDLPAQRFDRFAAADDAAVVDAEPDLLLQILVLELQAFAQPIDLLERAAQLLLGLLALRDVAEHDDRTDHDAPVADRRRRVLDRDRASALVPEHLVADRVHGAVAERGIDRAVLARIRPAVGVVVMHELVHVAADELGRAPAEQRLG